MAYSPSDVLAVGSDRNAQYGLPGGLVHLTRIRPLPDTLARGCVGQPTRISVDQNSARRTKISRAHQRRNASNQRATLPVTKCAPPCAPGPLDQPANGFVFGLGYLGINRSKDLRDYRHAGAANSAGAHRMTDAGTDS